MNKLAKYIKNNFGTIIISIVLFWFIITFLILPNMNILLDIFIKDGKLSLSSFSRLLNSERAMKSLKNSVILAISLVVTTNILGIFTVLVTEYFDIKFSKILKLGYFTPMIYSGVVLVSGYQFIYGNTGIITKMLLQVFPSMNDGWFQGFAAVLFVMTFSCTTNHLIFLTNAVKKIDFQTIEAAKSMGASTGRVLWSVVLPVLKPNIFSITVLLFLTGLSATSAPLIVGGTNFQTINPLIISFANSPTSRDLAATLALILGIATMLVLYVTKKIEERSNYVSVSKVKSKIVKQKIDNKMINLIVHICSYAIFIIYMLPIIFIVIFSFTDGYSVATGTLSLQRFTMANYVKLFTDFASFKPYLVSIVYSLAAAFIVITLVILAINMMKKYKKKSFIIEGLMLIPWFLPSTLIAMGLMLYFNVPRLLIGGNVLLGTQLLLLVGYIIVLIPFTLRMLKADFFNMDESLEEAARVLGASKIVTFFKITLPTILPSILAVFALNFTGKLADYDFSVFLYYPLLQPLGIVIKASTDSTATIDAKAMTLVYSVVLMIISAIAIYFVYGRNTKES